MSHQESEFCDNELDREIKPFAKGLISDDQMFQISRKLTELIWVERSTRVLCLNISIMAQML